jgi:hypothetical protein
MVSGPKLLHGDGLFNILPHTMLVTVDAQVWLIIFSAQPEGEVLIMSHNYFPSERALISLLDSNYPTTQPLTPCHS